MTRYSKILTVFVAVASLAFLGFAIATTFGGPDWEALVRTEEFRGYKITRSLGEKPVWTAVRGSDGQNVATSPVLPEVLVKVMDDISQRRQAQIQALQSREPLLNERIQALEAALVVDTEALQQYENALRVRLQAMREAEIETAGKVLSATAEAQKLENVVVARRDDILRLRQQVEELKADLFALKEQRGRLTNELVQLQADAIRAQSREQQLEQSAR